MIQLTFDRTLKINTALALGGLIVWVLISMMTNRREAWDSDLFWSLGVPLMLLMNVVAAFVDPSKVVLKGMLSVVLQPVAMIVMAGEIGSMFPLGLILFGFMGLFYSVGGAIGAFFKKQFFTSRKTEE
ncbi:MAG: hypothetical protein HYV29_02540 [Ignavibacteriales bacterium]|nr:hypothetical protein [Ignavibacteriales bacterium]